MPALTRNEEWHNVGKGREGSYRGGIGYSYLNPDDVLFTAKLSYSGSPTESASQGDVRIEGQPNTKIQIVENRLNKSPRLGLYFQKSLKRNNLWLSRWQVRMCTLIHIIRIMNSKRM